MNHFEVIVVGAGAAGLMAATVAAERGKQVLLLEKNRRAGTKILMSGGTRCNITHATDRKGIIAAYRMQERKQGDFLHSALAALSPDDLLAFFHAEGVATKTEPGGKVFPVSNQASDVLEALLERLYRSGAKLALGEALSDLRVADTGGFELGTASRTLCCDKLVLTTGGKSYPGSGTTGDGYAWLKKLGHKIVPPRPALTPVTTNLEWVRELKGITIPDVSLTLADSPVRAANPNSGGGSKNLPVRKSDRVDERRGSFLFTHFGLSGPAPLDISRSISGHAKPAALSLSCDFLPNQSTDEFQKQCRTALSSNGKKSIMASMQNMLPQFPKRLLESLLAASDVAGDLRSAEVSKSQLQAISVAFKSNAIPVSGTRGFKKAEVTAGGLSLVEVDSSTMQSRMVPNLFIAGELLDLDGPIGGYNFQAAFSTAWLAGMSV